MSTLQQIENEIAQLSAADFCQLLKWIEELDPDPWDREMEKDALAGKFDALAQQAREDARAGRATPI